MASGVVDGIFVDKWPNGCTQNGTNTTDWKVCNHWCGGVTEAKAKQFNAGKEVVLSQLMNIVRDVMS